jgi:hypothetical protein
MAGPSSWLGVSSRSLYFQNAIFGFLNLASVVIWVPELGFGCHPDPGPNGSKPALDADVARSYMWGPRVSWLYFYLFLFLFYFGSSVATISRIFQKLYLFRMISDEDNFYIKIIALDEIYDFLVLSFF